ncbi:hypothetical protein SAMN04488563_5394 [Jiangella alkaliphila]|uniref:Uncharacterized protein n=2 Tax=Jiangella alkaliphila TaxID=419479 RepID=A0A1H2L868_9ACTN|nr:hypothetical protein SAMN04488563_5394 [Jiangella alkaliphila]
MAAEDPDEVRCVVGDLRLSVSRLGSGPLRPGEMVTHFESHVRSTSRDLPGQLFDHLFDTAEGALTARHGLRLWAGHLVQAGEDFYSDDPGGVRYPIWLSAMAARYLFDLRMVALTGATPAEMLTVGIPADRLLVGVEVAREALRAEARLSGPRLVRPESLDELRRIAANADQDVTVADPDDPRGPPLYEGPASEAHQRLSPGRYRAHLLHQPAHRLVVIVARSEMYGGPMAASFSRLRSVERPRQRANGPGAHGAATEAPSARQQSDRWAPGPRSSPRGAGGIDPPAPGL